MKSKLRGQRCLISTGRQASGDKYPRWRRLGFTDPKIAAFHQSDELRLKHELYQLFPFASITHKTTYTIVQATIKMTVGSVLVTG